VYPRYGAGVALSDPGRAPSGDVAGGADTLAGAPADPRPDEPGGLRVAAILSGQALLVTAAVALVATVLARLAVVTVPVAIAVLLAALLTPAVRALTRCGVPRGLGAALVLVVAIAAFAAVGYGVVAAIGDALPALRANLTAALDAGQEWLRTGPLRGVAGAVLPVTREGLALLDGDPASLTGTGIAATAVGLALTLGELAAGLLLVLFVLVFLLYDGAAVWAFALGVVPARARSWAHRAGLRAFAALTTHLYAAAITSILSAVGTGLGLGLLGVPLAVPLAAVVLLGGFVPVVGPLVGGTTAVLVTLVALGPWRALAVLVLIVGLSVLAHRVVVPFLLGRPAPLHPLVAVLAVAVGVVVAGLVGALLVVPLLVLARGATGPLREGPLGRRGSPLAAQDG